MGIGPVAEQAKTLLRHYKIFTKEFVRRKKEVCFRGDKFGQKMILGQEDIVQLLVHATIASGT